jgi:hypothetical protein
MKSTCLYLSILALPFALPVSSQAPSAAPVAAPRDTSATHTHSELAALVPAPDAKDVASPEAIVGAAYGFISGPKGPRNWDRFRSLCLPGMRITRAQVDPEAGKSGITIWSVEEFLAYGKPILESTDFYESALVNRTHRFGHMAEVFSSYASRSTPDGKPFARGINTWELVSDGTRWWIAGLAWDEERKGLALPKEMQR